MSLDIVHKFNDKRVLLVGDTIIDIYTYCNVVCQALYAPIPEVEEVRSNISFGGNSLIATNILELGGKVTFVSVVGDDSEAKYYSSFTHKNLKKFFFVDKSRKTTVKQRWFADGRPLLQVNSVDNHDISLELEAKIFEVLEREVKKVDVIVVMDPQHGFLTRNMIAKLLELSKRFDKPLYVDVQISHRKSKHIQYRGADTFFLNRKEAKAIHPGFTPGRSRQLLKEIARRLKTQNVVVKLGEKGSVALLGGRYIVTKAHSVEAVDVCGAGDSFLAVFSLCDREMPEHSLDIANVWGGLATTIHGTVPPKREALVKVFEEHL